MFYLINVIAWFVEIALYLGLAKVSLLFVDKHKATLHNLYKNLPYVPYLIATVLFSMALLAGLLLFVIPAVVLIVVFGFYIYVLVDKKVGVMESFKQSAAITQGNRINLFLFSLVIGVVNLLGFLAFFLGLIVTIPVTILSVAYVYRKLSK